MKKQTYPKSITKFIRLKAEDSQFINGKPPIEDVEITKYDESWPKIYETIKQQIVNELDHIVIKIDHIGSTAIPGIIAKPWIDIDLSVQDTELEEKYVSSLEKIGFELIVREPLFYGHRLFILKNPRVNLHVFNANSDENIRHILFRDWLRENKSDRELYESIKKVAIKGNAQNIQNYHEKKQEIVLQIYGKIFASLNLNK